MFRGHLLKFLPLIILSPTTLQAGSISEIVAFGASINLSGRTNGPAWVDYLAADLGLPRRNLSSSGASTSALKAQVRSYLRCRRDICSREPDPDALYASLDWSFGVDTGSGDSPSVAATSAAANIATLAEAGAKNFLVGRLSWIPLYAPNWRRNISVQASFREAEELFLAEVTSLERTHGISVIDVDLNSLADQVVADPPMFGLTNVRDALERASNANPNEYMWWDGFGHVSTAYHRIIADESLAAITEQIIVPEPCTLVLGISAVLGLGVCFVRQHLITSLANRGPSVVLMRSHTSP